MSSETQSPQVSNTCPHCLAGTFSLKRLVYARWYGRHFVTIPNFPSWVCDVCGSLEYDAAALEQVRMIFGREAGAAPEAGRRPGASPAPFLSQPRSPGRRPV
jgi:YgiT-type zinc finger domain-containing protein